MFDSRQADSLRQFLAAPDRPQDTLSYGELCGFLFAICCSPEMVPPSNWLPLVFNDQPAGYGDDREAQQIQLAMMALYNLINEGVQKKEPGLPPGCEASRVTMANFEDDAAFGKWARGFGMGHDYLSQLWDAYTPAQLQDDLASCLLVLTFFAHRELAEDYRQELGAADKSIDELSQDMLGHFPEALLQYTLIGRSISDVLQKKSQPARSTKVGRNDPCPCGSGKKYKSCCGSTLH